MLQQSFRAVRRPHGHRIIARNLAHRPVLGLEAPRRIGAAPERPRLLQPALTAPREGSGGAREASAPGLHAEVSLRGGEEPSKAFTAATGSGAAGRAGALAPRGGSAAALPGREEPAALRHAGHGQRPTWRGRSSRSSRSWARG